MRRHADTIPLTKGGDMTGSGKWILGVLACGALLAGCASYNEIRQATDQLAVAKAAGAEEKAPYDYTAADLYLQAAVEERKDFDWKAASEWARRSSLHSAKALEQAKGGAQ